MLHLSYSEQNADGEMASPSRFLEEIPRHCIHRSERLDALPTHLTSASISASTGTGPSTLTSSVSETSQHQQRQQKKKSKNLQQTQHVEHLQEENERPFPATTTENVTTSTIATGPRQQQGTLDNLLPQHAARAGRLEKAARRPSGSAPLRQGPPVTTTSTTENTKQKPVGSDACRQGGQGRGGGNGRRPLKLMRGSSGA